MWFIATGLSHAIWMCLASLVGTEVPEKLVQMFSTETTDWSVSIIIIIIIIVIINGVNTVCRFAISLTAAGTHMPYGIT